MKWIMLIGISFILCSCCTGTVVQYRQVTVAPVVENVTFYDVEPIDVTTTTIDFY